MCTSFVFVFQAAVFVFVLGLISQTVGVAV